MGGPACHRWSLTGTFCGHHKPSPFAVCDHNPQTASSFRLPGCERRQISNKGLIFYKMLLHCDTENSQGCVLWSSINSETVLISRFIFYCWFLMLPVLFVCRFLTLFVTIIYKHAHTQCNEKVHLLFECRDLFIRIYKKNLSRFYTVGVYYTKTANIL